jgi:hypothetical protein
MGKPLGDVTNQAIPGLAGPSIDAQVERLTKLVHILWKEVERLEGIVQVIPEGLRIKSGSSEVLVLKNGGIILKGLRIDLSTPGQGKLYY